MDCNRGITAAVVVLVEDTVVGVTPVGTAAALLPQLLLPLLLVLLLVMAAARAVTSLSFCSSVMSCCSYCGGCCPQLIWVFASSLATLSYTFAFFFLLLVAPLPKAPGRRAMSVSQLACRWLGASLPR